MASRKTLANRATVGFHALLRHWYVQDAVHYVDGWVGLAQKTRMHQQQKGEGCGYVWLGCMGRFCNSEGNAWSKHALSKHALWFLLGSLGLELQSEQERHSEYRTIWENMRPISRNSTTNIKSLSLSHACLCSEQPSESATYMSIPLIAVPSSLGLSDIYMPCTAPLKELDLAACSHTPCRSSPSAQHTPCWSHTPHDPCPCL